MCLIRYLLIVKKFRNDNYFLELLKNFGQSQNEHLTQPRVQLLRLSLKIST